MKKVRISKKIIAAFMAFMIVFVSAPMQAIAFDDANADTINENTIEYGYEIDKNVFIVEEDISKRGQFEKHYLCSDGTYVSVTYSEAIHYLDDDNKWQDVDQSLSYDSATGMYISDKADFEVSFSKKASADNLARIERNGYTLSWGIQTTKKSVNALPRSATQPNTSINSNTDVILIPSSSASAVIEKPIDNEKTDIKNRLVADNDTFVLPKISSQISYSNIFDETQNVSLKYTVYHNKIEEDIIISERGDLQSVSMNMDVGALTPVVNTDGSVDLVDSDYAMQFRIGIPYMVDADHNVCNDIQVTAVKSGTSCVITYTPDTEWFESSARVFPILLDPAITTSDYVSNIEDTYVEENSAAIHSSEQYLYITRNGGNKRNAIVRITKLPNIDSSMPIIYASLSLTMSSAATDYVELKADYFDSPLELYEYDYSLTTGDYFSYTSYSAIDYDDTTITFDVTAHIYEMYADKKFDDENGYAYQGDFVIGYDDATDTTHAPPFFSSEYTAPSSRPMFVVKYGYALPAGMVNGGIYSFINSGSAAYMSVNGTDPANNSNIYQISNESGAATASQKFRLEYVSGTGGYLLRSLSSSSGTDKVAGIDRNGGELAANMNVRLSSATDSMAQEWLIVPVEYNLFKIVPQANMSLTLTVCGINDGTNSGTSSTSPGNIFVKAHEDENAYQQWYICDNNDTPMDTSNSRSNVETGNYFLGNSYSGRYLHRASGISVNSMCGRQASLGESTVKWKIVNLGDGYCTIQRSDMPRYYLAPTSAVDGSNVRIYISDSETIEENFKWSIRIASGGGCIIQHKASGMCLTDCGESANPSTVKLATPATPGTDAYSKQVWRVADEDYYVELGIAFSFDDMAIDVGESKAPSVNKKPANATWASYTDFDYTITSGTDYVSYDSNTKKFTGRSVGTASVTAVHKTTGLTDSFTIKVNNNAIIIIPGILGSELFVGNGNPYFEKDMPLFSKEILNGLASYQDGDTVQDLIPSNWWDGLKNIPSAVRLFNAWSDSMSCNDTGSSKYDVCVKEYRSADPSTRIGNHCGTGDAYLTLYNKLVATYSGEYSIDMFSYDWRLSNAVSASKLDEYIEYHNYDKVILIAHSMGGLVASGYLGLGASQRDKVEHVFYLASPLLGTPTIANVWYNEDISFVENTIANTFGISVEDFNRVYKLITDIADPIKNLICNYVSIYELFPSAYYFQLTGAAYMSESFTTIIIGGETTLTECSTYAATKSILTGYFDDFDSNLMAIAEAFHNTTFISGNHVSSYVDARYYHCLNNSVATISHLKFYQVVSSTSYVAGLEVDETTNYGDFLVLTTSSTLANRYPTKCLSFSGDHMSLVMISTVIDQWMQNIS